ncbi:MAG: carboxypeptidase-like regulatory domain-containing protein, partial [Vicinamibacterales bacterium]
VTVRAGQEAAAPFALIVARMAKIRGRVFNSSGAAIGGRSMLMLTPADPMMGFMSFSNTNNAMVDSEGAFEFTNVAPGRYTINVRPMGMPGGASESARMPITVGSDDIDNVVITTSAGATARGMVLTDDGTPLPFRADQVQIFASSTDPSTQMMGSGPPKVNEDFTFEMTGLFERRTIRGNIGMGQPIGWFLKAVIYDGHDVTDTGIDFQPGRTYEGVQLIFTQKSTSLSGLVTDDRNRPIVDVTVVIFSLNSERWGMQSRYFRAVRPDTNGRYNARNLPPSDEYGIIAVRNLEPGQSSDPEFLTRARDDAKPFSLTEGETKTVDIRLSVINP